MILNSFREQMKVGPSGGEEERENRTGGQVAPSLGR